MINFLFVNSCTLNNNEEKAMQVQQIFQTENSGIVLLANETDEW